MLTELPDGRWQTVAQTPATCVDYEKVLKPGGFCFREAQYVKEIALKSRFEGKKGDGEEKEVKVG